MTAQYDRLGPVMPMAAKDYWEVGGQSQVDGGLMPHRLIEESAEVDG